MSQSGSYGSPPIPPGTYVESITFLNALYIVEDPSPNYVFDFGDTNGVKGFNVGFGYIPNFDNSSPNGVGNTILGWQVMLAAGAASENVAIGLESLRELRSGKGNVAVGAVSGINYTSSESNNIVINHSGVVADSGVTRIGTNGVQTSCYITGIDGVNVGSVARVVTESSDQLGTATITAGTGISVTPGANTITIAATGTTSLTYTNVNTSPYVVLSTDEYLSVDCSGGAITLQFPNAATSGRTYIIKDRTGSAATHNITITTVGGAVNIDGATTFVMNTNYESANLMGNGTTFEVY